MTEHSQHTVIITGASGLLGRALMRKFDGTADGKWITIGLAHSRAGNGLQKIDLLEADAVQKVILENQPSVIIHSAAERNCNTVDNNYDAAFNLNVNSTKHIAKLAAEIGAVLIYISTDYVFDGNNPPYKEIDVPNPLNKYGLTKLEGEKVTLQEHNGACILRVPVLYGQVEHLQESVVIGLLTNLIDVNIKNGVSEQQRINNTSLVKIYSRNDPNHDAQHKDNKLLITGSKFLQSQPGSNSRPLSLVSNYEIRYPTYVDDIAAVCLRLAEESLKEKNDVKGIYHCSAQEALTKYGMLQIMAKCFGLPMVHVEADSRPTQGAPRPFDSHLDTSRLNAIVNVKYKSFEEGIKACLTCLS